MTLEFEGIFLVSWIFRIVILSYVTIQKINLYYLLLPFKPIARTDLLAVYRLFEHLTKENL